ncbi:TPA: hypothetical protein DDW35_12325 [Candidatus Sumerlaeota bacterium]|jgi:hypothetical protein|nr:hypothetical protein [Candidatus Sumerlaeota bacterium]
MMKPFFAKGKTLARNLTQAASAGSQLLPIDTPSDFAVGDRIFCAESGAGLEYLGVVLQVNTASLEVSLPLKITKTVAATLWRPSYAFQWSRVLESSSHTTYQNGMVVERAVGGALWPVRTADPTHQQTLSFHALPLSSFNVFRAWLDTAVRSGLDEFTWVSENGEVARVRLLDADFKEVDTCVKSINLSLPLAVLQEGGYA